MVRSRGRKETEIVRLDDGGGQANGKARAGTAGHPNVRATQALSALLIPLFPQQSVDGGGRGRTAGKTQEGG